MLFNVIPCSFRNVPALPAACISGLRRCCAGQSASTPEKLRGARGQMADLERENGWLIWVCLKIGYIPNEIAI